MDKQQATTYIKERLDQDLPREEIIRGLVEQLHAPEAMVSKFVVKVETEYHKQVPQPSPTSAPPQPVKLPSWLAELSAGQSLSDGQQMSADQTDTTVATNDSRPSWEEEARNWVTSQLKIDRLHSDIAYELADRVSIPLYQAENLVTTIASQVESVPLPKITTITEAADFVKAAYIQRRPKLEIAAELAVRTGEPQDLTEIFVIKTIAQLEKTMALEQPAPGKVSRVALNTPKTVKYVIAEFARHRKRSDIVMSLCERTGADWQEAQRFVAQVSAENHTRINARKNILIIPMGIGAVVLGLLLTLGAAYPIVIWFTRGAGELRTMSQSGGWIGDYVQVAPYLFFTGIAFMAGGALGLVIALRSQIA